MAETLADLEVDDLPLIVALNKIDAVADDRRPDPQELADCLQEFPSSLPISAAYSVGLDALLARVEEVLAEDMLRLTVQVPYDRGDLVALFHEQATLVQVSHDELGTMLEGYLPRRWLQPFRDYVQSNRRDPIFAETPHRE